MQKHLGKNLPVVSVDSVFVVVVGPGTVLDGAAFAAYDSAAVPGDYRLDRPIIINKIHHIIIK